MFDAEWWFESQYALQNQPSWPLLIENCFGIVHCKIVTVCVCYFQMTMPGSNVVILTDPASDLSMHRNGVIVYPIEGEYSRDKLMLQRIRSYIVRAHCIYHRKNGSVDQCTLKPKWFHIIYFGLWCSNLTVILIFCNAGFLGSKDWWGFAKAGRHQSLYIYRLRCSCGW